MYKTFNEEESEDRKAENRILKRRFDRLFVGHRLDAMEVSREGNLLSVKFFGYSGDTIGCITTREAAGNTMNRALAFVKENGVEPQERKEQVFSRSRAQEVSKKVELAFASGRNVSTDERNRLSKIWSDADRAIDGRYVRLADKQVTYFVHEFSFTIELTDFDTLCQKVCQKWTNYVEDNSKEERKKQAVQP